MFIRHAVHDFSLVQFLTSVAIKMLHTRPYVEE